MSNNKRTLASISYGITSPSCLVEKLKREGAKLVEPPYDSDDVFNFFITVSVLVDWICNKYYSKKRGLVPTFPFQIDSGMFISRSRNGTQIIKAFLILIME